MPAARPFSRRHALFLGGGATLMGLLGPAACGGEDSPSSPSPTPAPGTATTGAQGTVAPASVLKQPDVIRSRNGVLDATLTIESKMVGEGPARRWAITVNGATPGPTLRIKPGDRLRLLLDNRLAHSTNLHTHGLRASPSGNADNPFIEVAAGKTFQYEINIPANHPGGLFWYHPHLHHHVAEQLFGGMFGAIIVEDAADDLAELKDANERLLILADTRVATSEAALVSTTMMQRMQGREGTAVFVSGQANPVIEAAPGKLERWH